jgi:transposase-like protein
MASLRMTLLDLLNKSEQGADPNFLRDGVQLLAQELMDAEVTDLVGAEPHQRNKCNCPSPFAGSIRRCSISARRNSASPGSASRTNRFAARR